MEFYRHKILCFPLLFLASYFLVDKIFLLPSVRRQTQHWSNLEDYFYGSRERLFQMLVREEAAVRERAAGQGDAGVRAKAASRAKRAARGSAAEADGGVVLIFGSSRSAPFPVDPGAGFGRAFPGARQYNFSAPSACPSYYAYWLARIRTEVGPRIRLALIEFDPALLGSATVQPSLAYSYDPGFVLSHLDWRDTGRGFSFAEAETFLLKRYVALYRYPLHPGHILENRRTLRFEHEGRPVVTTQLALKDRLFAMMHESFEDLRGGIPYPVTRAYSDAELEIHAQEAVRRYLETDAQRSQLYFFEMLLGQLTRARVPVLLYWPVVSTPLRRQMRALGLVEEWQDRLGKDIIAGLKRQNADARIVLIDLNEDPAFRCRQFSDSYHLAGSCFGPLTERLLEVYRGE